MSLHLFWPYDFLLKWYNLNETLISLSFTTPPRSDQGLRSADFIRARNIIVLAHGNRPRKVVRILLNKKTVHSVEGVLDMISESIGFAVKKLVSVPNGLAIHRLEDLFDSYYIFIALRHAKGKISPDDFQVIFHSFTLQTVV